MFATHASIDFCRLGSAAVLIVKSIQKWSKQRTKNEHWPSLPVAVIEKTKASLSVRLVTPVPQKVEKFSGKVRQNKFLNPVNTFLVLIFIKMDDKDKNKFFEDLFFALAEKQLPLKRAFPQSAIWNQSEQ